MKLKIIEDSYGFRYEQISDNKDKFIKLIVNESDLLLTTLDHKQQLEKVPLSLDYPEI